MCDRLIRLRALSIALLALSGILLLGQPVSVASDDDPGGWGQNRQPPPDAPPPPPGHGPHGDRLPPPPGGPGHPGHGDDGMMPPPPPPWGPLIRMLAERRPELAQRLERLRRDDPQRFEQVIMEAFMVRLEQSVSDLEATSPPAPSSQPGTSQEVRPPDRPDGPHGPGPRPGEFGEPHPRMGPHPEQDAHMRELQERQEQLEQQSRKLAQQIRELPDSASAAERQRLRDELTKVAGEQFDVRTELRRAEVKNIEQELERLRQTVERMRQDIDRRLQERDSILQRRVEQLLGQHGDGW